MSDAFDNRRKGLEEEYFRRQDREALEKLRAKRAAEGGPERAVAADAAARTCPLGHGALTEIAFEDVFIDRCEQCLGVWLDAGELQHLTQREEGGSWFGRLFGGGGRDESER
ncbi:MAG TPA: zf-TFIIB domain-containing protein [Pyrinomonadaceae bacterium]|nr:zf-TFIIB domain-containing protein [Pyrinomonadaceae bacterium]